MAAPPSRLGVTAPHPRVTGGGEHPPLHPHSPPHPVTVPQNPRLSTQRCTGGAEAGPGGSFPRGGGGGAACTPAHITCQISAPPGPHPQITPQNIWENPLDPPPPRSTTPARGTHTGAAQWGQVGSPAGAPAELGVPLVWGSPSSFLGVSGPLSRDLAAPGQVDPSPGGPRPCLGQLQELRFCAKKNALF